MRDEVARSPRPQPAQCPAGTDAYSAQQRDQSAPRLRRRSSLAAVSRPPQGFPGGTPRSPSMSRRLLRWDVQSARAVDAFLADHVDAGFKGGTVGKWRATTLACYAVAMWREGHIPAATRSCRAARDRPAEGRRGPPSAPPLPAGRDALAATDPRSRRLPRTPAGRRRMAPGLVLAKRSLADTPASARTRSPPSSTP